MGKADKTRLNINFEGVHLDIMQEIQRSKWNINTNSSAIRYALVIYNVLTKRVSERDQEIKMLNNQLIHLQDLVKAMIDKDALIDRLKSTMQDIN